MAPSAGPVLWVGGVALLSSFSLGQGVCFDAYEAPQQAEISGVGERTVEQRSDSKSRRRIQIRASNNWTWVNYRRERERESGSHV
jgi:hypothetical protein